MSASIYTLLADELDISEEKAKKLLAAMLREVNKRARTRGVRLPNLGKFKEENGRLSFTPSDSLARAVNHRFEGLESEDLASAPTPQEEESTDQGPSTITLGYQNSSWSPMDAPESGEEEEDAGDTAEFQVPDAEDAADTEELQMETSPDPSPETEPSSPNEEASSPSPPLESEPEDEHEDVSSQVDDSSGAPSNEQPSSSSVEAPSSDYNRSVEEHESLSGIWESNDSEGEAVDPSSFSSDPAEPSAASDSTLFSSSPSPEEATETAPVEQGDDPSASEDASPSPPEESSPPDDASSKKSSSVPRVLVTVLVLLMLGGGAWYILGQRGLVPPPRLALTRMQTQVQSLAGGFSTESPTQSSTRSTEGSAESSESTGTATETAASSSESAASTSDRASGQARTITPADGGWSIIIASRTSRDAAQSLVDTYRDRLADQQVPVDLIEGTVDNSTRYRVGVGQFPSRSEAQRFLQQVGSKLPEGAWTLRLQ